MSTEALRTVKDRFSEYVDRVEREHEVVVTRNGRLAIVLISTGDVVRGVDAVRALRPAGPAARAIAEELSEAVAAAARKVSGR